jgi:hypothetical protein
MFELITAGVGLGLSIFGSMSAADEAKKSAQASQAIGGYEMDINEQHRQAMEIDAKRKQMEVFRRQQQVQSMALTNATSGGAQFGSGLAGGEAQIRGEAGSNLLNIDQNLTIGRNIFGLTSQIDQQKILQAQYQSSQATDQGIASIGSSLLGASSKIGNLGDTFSSGFKSFTSGFGSGDPNG